MTLTAAIMADVERQRRAAAEPFLRRAKRFRAHEIIDMPMTVEIVEGVVWEQSVTMLPAESGAGKTFVLNSIEAAIDAGVPWFGRRTLQGSTVHIYFEADAVNKRMRAIRDVLGFRLQNTYVILASEPLSPYLSRDGEERSIGERVIAEHLRELRDDLEAGGQPPVRMVSIDTVRASMTGSEDSSEHTSAYIRACRRLLTIVPTAGLALSHHAGWQDGQDARKRERGSSAWRGNVDATLYLEAGEYDRATGEARLTLHTRKVRDGEKPSPLHLIRRQVELPGLLDCWGRAVTTCVIEADRRSSDAREVDSKAAAAVATIGIDVKVLQVIAERPELATSQDGIRLVLNVRKAVISDAVARLVGHGLALPGTRGKAYTVTAEGYAALKAAADSNSSQRFPNGSRNGSSKQFPVPPLKGTGTGNCLQVTRTVPEMGGADGDRL